MGYFEVTDLEEVRELPEEEDHMMLLGDNPCTRIAPGVYKADTPIRIDPDKFMLRRGLLKCVIAKNKHIEYLFTREGYESIIGKDVVYDIDLNEYFYYIA